MPPKKTSKKQHTAEESDEKSLSDGQIDTPENVDEQKSSRGRKSKKNESDNDSGDDLDGLDDDMGTIDMNSGKEKDRERCRR